MNTLTLDILETTALLLEGRHEQGRAREIANNLAGRITLASSITETGLVVGEANVRPDFYDTFNRLVDGPTNPICRWMLAEVAAAGVAAAHEFTSGEAVPPEVEITLARKFTDIDFPLSVAA